MKLWILKKLVLFLKWFTTGFDYEIRILISPEPKRVILHNKQNITFLGDYVTFYKCSYIENCNIYATKESYQYMYDNYEVMMSICEYASNCNHYFLDEKIDRKCEVITRDDKEVSSIIFEPEKNNDFPGRPVKTWFRWDCKNKPDSGTFSNCTINTNMI